MCCSPTLEVCESVLIALVILTEILERTFKRVLIIHALAHTLASAESRYRPTDRILHFLPLHHTHGIVNKLLCPLWAGACVEFARDAKAETLVSLLAGQESRKENDRLTLFMAVSVVLLYVPACLCRNISASTKWVAPCPTIHHGLLETIRSCTFRLPSHSYLVLWRFIFVFLFFCFQFDIQFSE